MGIPTLVPRLSHAARFMVALTMTLSCSVRLLWCSTFLIDSLWIMASRWGQELIWYWYWLIIGTFSVVCKNPAMVCSDSVHIVCSVGVQIVGSDAKLRKWENSEGRPGREAFLFFRAPFYLAPLPTFWTPGTGSDQSLTATLLPKPSTDSLDNPLTDFISEPSKRWYPSEINWMSSR